MTNFSRVVVVGLGTSGVAAARLAAAEGASVVVTDLGTPAEVASRLDQLPPDTQAVLGEHPASCLDGADALILSPGVPPDSPIVTAARERGLSVLSEVEFAWSRRRDATLIAVTGSNGKSTVTTLIGEMLRADGRPTAVGGNLGPPASSLVLEEGWSSWVLEISSFQAETFSALRPDVAVFLNLSQDHLERHPDMAEYARAKGRLFANQGPADTAVLNHDDATVAATPTAARRTFFSTGARADAYLDGATLRLADTDLIARDELRLAGLHNVANALAAALAARAVGVDTASIRRTLATFEGLPHRHRLVHEGRGVRWIDDSKATNVGATLAALGGYPPHSVHLILGGLGKGQDFAPLAAAVARTAACVYLIGRDGPAIGSALADGVALEESETLERAVASAAEHARSGEVVLLAPACASFDQFTDYAERGRRFAALAAGTV